MLHKRGTSITLTSYSEASIPWNQWLLLFENFCCLNNVQDERIKQRLLIHYLGPKSFDQLYIMLYPKCLFNMPYDEFLKNCSISFGSNDISNENYNINYSYCYSMNDFINLKQSSNESISEFYLSLKQSAINLGLNDSELHQKIMYRTFMNGLYNLEIRKRLKKEKQVIKSLQEAYKFVRKYEKIEELKDRERKKILKQILMPRYPVNEEVPDF
uniref:Retrotransposon gag domain-containing protein n=1 Tax=Parastrongyloides trichosuri TaxID=131310 RepID=A0A0N4ZHB0_PARTI